MRPPSSPNPSAPSCPDCWAQVSSSQYRMLHNLLGRWRMLTQARILFCFLFFFWCEFYSSLEEPAGRRRGPGPIWQLLFLMSYYPIINISISNDKAAEMKQPRIFKFNHSWGCKWLIFLIGQINVWLLYTLIICLMTWFMIVIYE